jgi:hypothetical protein
MEGPGGGAAVASGDQPAPQQLALNVLQTTRAAQTQNGLKHGDYGRYRCPKIQHRRSARARCLRRREVRERAPPARAEPRAPHPRRPQGVLRTPPAVPVQGPQLHPRQGALPAAQAGGRHDRGRAVRGGLRAWQAKRIRRSGLRSGRPGTRLALQRHTLRCRLLWHGAACSGTFPCPYPPPALPLPPAKVAPDPADQRGARVGAGDGDQARQRGPPAAAAPPPQHTPPDQGRRVGGRAGSLCRGCVPGRGGFVPAAVLRPGQNPAAGRSLVAGANPLFPTALSEVCDTRSALEAEAYAAWMAGNVLLEKEADWARALGHFSRAKWGRPAPARAPVVLCLGLELCMALEGERQGLVRVRCDSAVRRGSNSRCPAPSPSPSPRKLFAELAKVGDLDSQGLCGAMVEEIEPSIRCRGRARAACWG